eukprot:TRINITY_DN3367_c0_g1_i2.p1 TRINITY_DN3367_c0_g1~~TRINITY_DN3367_c0_g1_i2.p1  ORF type:complete len:635 (+),score=222.92 TRINITY_DN3367_c0_g1_i2:65-1969(+)
MVVSAPRWIPVELSNVEHPRRRGERRALGGDRKDQTAVELGPIAQQVHDFVEQFRKLRQAALTSSEPRRWVEREQQWLRSAEMRRDVLQDFIEHHKRTVLDRARDLARIRQTRRDAEREERAKRASPLSEATRGPRGPCAEQLRLAEKHADTVLKAATAECAKAELLAEPLQRLALLLRDHQIDESTLQPEATIAQAGISSQAGEGDWLHKEKSFAPGEKLTGRRTDDSPPISPGLTQPGARFSVALTPLQHSDADHSLQFGSDGDDLRKIAELRRKEERLRANLKQSTDKEQQLIQRLDFMSQENMRLMRQIDELTESREQMQALAKSQVGTVGLIHRVAGHLNIDGRRGVPACSPCHGVAFWSLSVCAFLHFLVTWGRPHDELYSRFRLPFELALPGIAVFLLDCVAAGVLLALAHEWYAMAESDLKNGMLRVLSDWLSELEAVAGDDDSDSGDDGTPGPPAQTPGRVSPRSPKPAGGDTPAAAQPRKDDVTPAWTPLAPAAAEPESEGTPRRVPVAPMTPPDPDKITIGPPPLPTDQPATPGYVDDFGNSFGGPPLLGAAAEAAIGADEAAPPPSDPGTGREELAFRQSWRTEPAPGSVDQTMREGAVPVVPWEWTDITPEDTMQDSGLQG